MRTQVTLTCSMSICWDEELEAILLVLLLWNLVLMGTLVAPKPQPPFPLLASLSPTMMYRLMEAGVSWLRVARSGPGKRWLKGTVVARRTVVTASRSLEAAQHSLAHCRDRRPLYHMAWATCPRATHSLPMQWTSRDTATRCSTACSNCSKALLFSWQKLTRQ